jgi:predicted amidohydrolase YtcJ
MRTADIIITNARVLTMDNARPRATYIALGGGKIIALDDVSTLKAPHTRIIDAQNCTVMPGIIESHLHLFIGAIELESLNVSQIKGLDAFTKAVREYAAKRPKDSVIVAKSAFHAMLRPDGIITRHDLDHALPDRPLILGCFDQHTVWANTKALQAARILEGMALPPGNEIVMGPDGKATGELKEFAAYAPVMALTPTQGREILGLSTGEGPVPPATAAQRATDASYLKKGLDYCASLGITTIHLMDGNFYQLELLEKIRKDGDLVCRAQVPWHQKNFMDISRLDDAARMRASYEDDLLFSGRVKVFMDGVLESLTALTLEDYPGHPDNRGLPNFTAEEFNALAIKADRLGLQITVHAIGDGAVRRTLDGFEAAQKANGKRDSRHRIEHLELIDPADIPRFAALGVIASMQPIVALGVPGVPLEPCMSRVVDKLGYTFAWQRMRDAGARVIFSSDWPVSPLDPFLGMQAAMTRKQLAEGAPEQKQTLMDSLAAYTRDGAYAEFTEDRKGQIKPGYFADVVILDRDIEATPPELVGKVKPAVTIGDGRVTFEA